MKTDTKQYINPNDKLKNDIEALGYRQLLLEDEALFDKYYSMLDGHYSSNLCFLNLYCWEDTLPTYFKEYEGFLVDICYDFMSGEIFVYPFMGKYTNEGIAKVFEMVRSDMEYLGVPYIIRDVSSWMRPYYEATGAEIEVIDLRQEMDYIFTPESFWAGMNTQDDRYRYKYFKRKNNYETVEITPDMVDEVTELMERVWCVKLGDCEECAYGCLKDVVVKLVKAFDKLNIQGILVRVDGVAQGISIVSEKYKMGVYQYKNAENKIKGINEYLLRECFERYMSGAEIINYTEDLGHENLRRYKEHMAPEFSLYSKLFLKVK